MKKYWTLKVFIVIKADLMVNYLNNNCQKSKLTLHFKPDSDAHLLILFHYLEKKYFGPENLTAF